MKRFHYALKVAVMMIAVFSATFASAEVKRMPDPGPATPTAEQIEFRKSRDGFLKFVKELRSHNSTEIAAEYAPGQLQFRQRPEKILRTPWDPEGNFYVVVPNFNGMNSYADAFYGRLDTESGTMQKIWRNAALTNQEEAYMQSGFVRDNILYTPKYVIDMVTQDVEIIWKRFDISTGKSLSALSFSGTKNPWMMFTYGLTYDPIHDVVYGISYDNATGAGGGLIMVDCSKPDSEWEGIELFNVGGSVADWMAGICYDPLTDTLYGLKSQGILCEIDLENKGVLTLKEFDDFMEDFCFPPVMQANPMCYSPHDKSLVYIYGGTNAIYSVCSIDTESYDAYEITNLSPTSQVGAIYCADAFAQDEAPALMNEPELEFKGSSLKGTYTFTAPSTYYNGLKLDKNVLLHVLVDGVEIFSKEVAPGETVTNEVELTSGLHTIKGYCSLGDLQGPPSSKRIYIGNDQPFPPTDLKYSDGVLTWKAPVNKGVNNAYIDLSNVTYDVYVDGVKHNSQPVTTTSYAIAFNDPADGRKKLTVTATANGVTSDPSNALSRVLGKGYNLPLTIAPTAAEATLFETIDANNDGNVWSYEGGSMPNFTVTAQDYTVKPNDWLILPPLYFDSPTDIYNLVVNYVNARQNNIQKDNLEVYIAKDPTVESMHKGKLIYSHYERIQPYETELDIRFSIAEPGTYFIGFHSMPGNENLYRGIQLRNFRINKASGSTTAAPGELTDVTLTPAPLGELFVTVDAKLPMKDMAGNDLPADQVINLAVESDAGISNLSGKPGDKVHTVMDVEDDGFADIFITPSNESGEGSRQYFSVYAGYDNPLPPANIRTNISADNLTLTVSWDPVGNVGEHGGYVDPEEVTYDFYSHYSAAQDPVKLGTAGKNCTFSYTISSVPQQRLYVGPVAVNSIGISTNGQFVNETLGKLYATPMLEEWGYAEFTYQKWLYATVEPFKNVEWQHCTEPDGTTGDISFGQGGSMRAVNHGAGKNWGELRAPRLSTASDPRVGATLRYWNYPHAGHMELWGRTFDNQEFRKIAELDPTCEATGRWEDWEVILPEDFCFQPWIQVNVRAYISGNESVIIDNYQIAQVIDNDFQLTSISGPYSAFVGEEPKFDILVTNNGIETGTGTLTLELYGEDLLLESKTIDIERVRHGEDFQHYATFPMLESYVNYAFLELKATAKADGDQNPRNDEKSIEILLYDSSLPVVRDLTAERAENGADVNLKWSTPDTKEKGLESAEVYAPFQNIEKIGPWTNVDIDGKSPFVIQNKRWSNDDNPSAWTVFNAEEMKTMEEERLSPRSGKQMLLARSVAYDTSADKPTRSMDFLISPEVKGGSQVSFWMNTLDSQYAETIAIFYSSTDMTLGEPDVDLQDREAAPRQCGSFKWLKNFTKSGSETWEKCEFTLPEDAKYFAFVYSSFGMFGALLDDIVYQPVNPVDIDIDSYEVLVSYDGETPQVAMRNVKENSFVHTGSNGRGATYYVKANVYDGEALFQSPLSNPAYVVTNSIEGLEAGQFVAAGKGKIVIGGAAGKNVTISDVEGKIIRKTAIAYDPQTFALDAGIYLVRLGDATVKVIVR